MSLLHLRKFEVSRHFINGQRTFMKYVFQVRWFPDRDGNPGADGRETALLTVYPRRLVCQSRSLLYLPPPPDRSQILLLSTACLSSLTMLIVTSDRLYLDCKLYGWC